MKYYLIAGEPSGDLHGANLIEGLKKADPGAEFRFWGGDRMAAAGGPANLRKHYRETSFFGVVQVLRNLGTIRRQMRECREDVAAWCPDVLILIDYPGFNLKMARWARRHDIRTFYYIAPKVWASRESRVKKLKAYVDKLFIVFPFEIPYFTKKGVGFVYKGNPLIDAIDNSAAFRETREEFLAKTGLPDRPMIALLAGSRNGEISSMMPTFMEFADRLHAIPEYSDYRFVVAAAPARSEADYARYVGDREYVSVVFGQSYAVMRHAKAAVVNSGTASLECALIGTPQVVAYKGAEINFLIAKSIIKIRYISLGNLILDRICFRELLQYYFTPGNVLNEVRRMIEDEDYRSDMLAGYQEIRDALGGEGASAAVARAMIEELRK